MNSNQLFHRFLLFQGILISSLMSFGQSENEIQNIKKYFSEKEFQFQLVDGIGFEEGVTRRDPSDVIKVGDTYYVYYTKVYGRSPGYWGTVWVAVSEDEGYTWTEVGEVLGTGAKGKWDSQAVFTPNIMEEDGTFYLYYTAVQPTPTNKNGEFENNSITDYTAIGVAMADNPLGPFDRYSKNPILTISKDRELFDSYRVDDAVLLKKNGKFRLYYKGRKYSDGNSGPLHTKMGVAFADSPTGPFEKYRDNPILNKSHEVFLWKQNSGIACLASLSSTFEYAPDGLDFTSSLAAVKIPGEQRPKAPGAFRPELTGLPPQNELSWGISMIHNGANCYLVRWELKNEKPNVIFILVDDLGWADLGYTGSTFYETPNIDRLASKGTVFTDAYAACPVCSPSRAAIMSGKYPARVNLTDYIPGNRHYGPHENQKLASHPFKLHLDLEEVTLAEAFKEAGYNTMFAGKWHLGEEEKYYPTHQGFDINKGGNNTGHPAGGYFAPYNNPQLEDGETGEYLTDRITDEVIDFIKSATEKPFLAYLSFYTVHLPMQGKPEKVKKYKQKLEETVYSGNELIKKGDTYYKHWQNMPHYAAMVESMDENVGRVLKFLEKEKLAENTIIVFTSDNGGMATSNRTDNIPTTNLPLRAGKGYLYEGGIRVPLIISWPGKINAGFKTDYPTIATDLYPTLMDLADIGLKKSQHVDGMSLKPVLKNEKTEERPIFWHYPHYSGGLGGAPSGAVRLGNFKLIEFFEDNHIELYNLEKDISEAYDLVETNPEKVNELKMLLHKWRKDVGAQMPFANPDYVGEN